jgi:signal transduction histidine kinase
MLLDRLYPDFGFPSVLAALAIVLTALTFGAGPSLLSALAAVLLINLTFIPPFYRLNVPKPADTVGLLLLLAVGVTISLVASRVESERRKAQALAAEREAMLEAMPDALLVYDEQRRVLQANSAARQLLATDGQDDFFTQPSEEQVARLAQRDLEGVAVFPERSPLARVLRGETLKGSGSQDMRIQALDGRDLRVNVSGAPVRDAEGRLVGAAIVLRDLTELRALERRTHEALEALLAMAETLVSSTALADTMGDVGSAGNTVAPVAKRLADLTRSVLGCRRVAITGIDPHTDLMRPIAVAGLSPDLERQWWAEQSQEARFSDSPDTAVVARLRIGEVVALDLTQPPYRDQPNPYHIRDILVAPMRIGEQLIGLLALDYGGATHAFTPDEIMLASAVAQLIALVVERERLLDEREEARASALALRTANERMNEFMGVASHELKTPVTSIKVNVQLGIRRLGKLARGPAAAGDERFRAEIETLQGVLERSDRTMVRLTRLVDDLLDISRIRAGRLELRREPCDLLVIVRDAVAEQREVAHERRIMLELPNVSSAPIVADEDRIGQVVTNFLTNALKYSAEQQPVIVRLDILRDLSSPQRAGAGGAVAQVSIQDHGPGLPPTEQEAIWEQFHRAAGVVVQSGSGVGLGLGLYISKTIVERHGGQVGLESAPGEGSTFWFTLPLAP